MLPIEIKTIVESTTLENIAFIEKKVSKLSDNQMDWIPNPGIWSIRQVLEHLNVTSKHYHDSFIKKVQSTRFLTPSENFVSSPLGRSAWKSMKLGNANNIKRKFKTPKSFNPALDLITDKNQVEKFLTNSHEFIDITDKAITVNLRKVKIPTALSKIVRLRLGDALLFVCYHNQRHIQQIANLMNSKNFPKKSNEK